MTSGRDTGLCATEAPAMVGGVLTGVGLTLDQAAALLARGEPLPAALTPVQRRLVDERAARL
jgi:hypothetical protein